MTVYSTVDRLGETSFMIGAFYLIVCYIARKRGLKVFDDLRFRRYISDFSKPIEIFLIDATFHKTFQKYFTGT